MNMKILIEIRSKNPVLFIFANTFLKYPISLFEFLYLNFSISISLFQFLYLYLDRLVEVREKDWMGSVSSSLIRSDIEPSSDRSNSRSWLRELSSPALECPEKGEPEPPCPIIIKINFF